MAESGWELTGDQPYTGNDMMRQEKEIVAVRVTMRNEILKALRAEIPLGTLAEAPVGIMDKLRELFEDRSDNTHRRLETEAKNATLKVGQQMSE